MIRFTHDPHSSEALVPLRRYLYVSDYDTEISSVNEEHGPDD